MNIHMYTRVYCMDMNENARVSSARQVRAQSSEPGQEGGVETREVLRVHRGVEHLGGRERRARRLLLGGRLLLTADARRHQVRERDGERCTM